MTESFGMQLDDDSLLALFSRVRPCPAPPRAVLVFACLSLPWKLLHAMLHRRNRQLCASTVAQNSCIEGSSVVVQYDPQASGVIDYQALMKQLLHSDYYALYLGTVDNTQNTLDATSTFDMITNLKRQFAAQGHKLQQVAFCPCMHLVTVLICF